VCERKRSLCVDLSYIHINIQLSTSYLDQALKFEYYILFSYFYHVSYREADRERNKNFRVDYIHFE